MVNLLIWWTVSDIWGWPFPLIFPGPSILKTSCTSKARQLVGLLFWQFYKHASADTIHKLYLTIVQPHLEYACEIWDPSLDCQMIESIPKFASRVCLKQWSRNTRYHDMLTFLNMPSLATRRRQRKLCTLVNNLSDYPSPSLIPRNPYYPSRCTLFVFCTSVCTY